MMSYLWILILGSLLASQTMAQEPDPDAGGGEVSEPAGDNGETMDGETPKSSEETTLGNGPDLSPAGVSTEVPTKPTTKVSEEGQAGGNAQPAGPTPSAAIDAKTTPEDPKVTTREQEVATTPGTAAPKIPGSTVTPADMRVATTAPVDDDDGSTIASQDSESAVKEETTTAKTSATTDAPAALVKTEPHGKTTVAANVNIDSNKDTTTSASTIKAITEEVVQLHFGRGMVKSGRGADVSSEEPKPRSGATNSGPPSQGGSGTLAGVLSGIIFSAVGAVSGYFAYQKKKLCFKNREGEADPEAGRKADAAEAKSDPQALNTLLNSS